jgi:G3E family GTPase
VIPLSLVTGFLGGGKTTLLQRLIERSQGRRLAYVVNELADADVDGQLLGLGEGEIVSIPGGSIFCRCLSGEFLRILQALPARFDDPEHPLEGVVVEASGIADPKVAVKMLQETRLDRVYELRCIVTVIDPGTFLKLIHTLPSVISQVEACDVALVNKTDLHEEAALRAVEEAIARIHPQARIIRSSYCRSEIDILAASPRRLLEGEYALCRDPSFASVAVPLDAPLEIAPLLAELDRIKNDVYRVKGFVPVPDGVVYVDVAAGRLNHRKVGVPAEREDGGGRAPGRLVFVFDPKASERVEGAIGLLKAGPRGSSIPQPV